MKIKEPRKVVFWSCRKSTQRFKRERAVGLSLQVY